MDALQLFVRVLDRLTVQWMSKYFTPPSIIDTNIDTKAVAGIVFSSPIVISRK